MGVRTGLLPGFGGTVSAIADVILGRCCAGCDVPGIALCQTCAAELVPRPRLRRSLDMDEIAEGLHLPIGCSLEYRGEVRQILYRYKDHRIPQLARVLGPSLAASVEFVARQSGVHPHELALAVLPTRAATAKRRGFDSLAAITKVAISQQPVKSVCTPLVDIRTAGQAKTLGVWERQHHVAGAFRLRGPIPRGPVMIVDDIVTTGATAREAAATLMLAGAHVIGVAAVAGTP